MDRLYQALRDAIQRTIYILIDRPIQLAVRVGITPNIITTLGLLGNIAAAAIFAWAGLGCQADGYALIGWGGAVILLSSIMDMVDGRMARTCNMASTFGAFYDSVLDRYCELFTLSGITFCFFAWHRYEFALVTLLSLIGSIMVSYIRARAEGVGLECKVGLMQRPERVVLTSAGAILCGCFSHVASFGPLWFLAVPQIVIALLANLTAIQRILHVKRQCA